MLIDTCITLSTDQANGILLAYQERMESKFSSIQTENQTLASRFDCLEARNPISVPVVTSNVQDTSGPSQAVFAPESAQSKPSSISVVRSLETAMPILMDDDFLTWVQHVLAYSRAVGWGSGDTPAVLTDDLHVNS